MVLSNTVTPRIYIAATHQNDGKTTTSLGLLAALRKRLPRIGFIKPVGQRFLEIDGHKIDEDSFLISKTYDVELPLEAMSPIAVDSKFTRRYLERGNRVAMEGTVQEAFNRVAWEHDFVIIEGTGHAGVGSVFDLSNARVAQLLKSKVIIVSQGGVGRPIDEISLNLALFEKHQVEVAGVIMNKVIPDKIESLYPFAEKGLARLGLPLLGMIPLHEKLPQPTLNQVAAELKGEFLTGYAHRWRTVDEFVIGATSSRNINLYFKPGTLIITAGDREDLILGVLEAHEAAGGKGEGIVGVILTRGFLPQPGLLKIMKEKDVPFLSVPFDSYTAASRISNMSIKTELQSKGKIKLIQDLVEQYVDVEQIINVASVTDSESESE